MRATLHNTDQLFSLRLNQKSSMRIAWFLFILKNLQVELSLKYTKQNQFNQLKFFPKIFHTYNLTLFTLKNLQISLILKTL